jgi:2-C-methyl-D-erythritol 4-phosphate cytidylyltransferase/2-C-methyl-D-erythritol 2,4-cyclodiphosphate synthase
VARVAAIIAAGGQGVRLGAAQPKQFLDLAGKSLLERSVDAFARSTAVDEIVVALPPADAAAPPLFLSKYTKPTTVVAGGSDRQGSVANAFARVSELAEVVIVHDAARPFVTDDLIRRTLDAAVEHGAAIAAIPARDTVKQIAPTGEPVVVATLPRNTIFLAQTPQAFRRDLLAHALEQKTGVATDEAMLLEQAGFEVHLVEGDPGNVKVTTQHDLAEARRRLGAVAPLRIGTGYDLHRLVTGRPLLLAGVRVPFELGLAGHSDADIVCHAVTDAVLGGAAIGDIGRLFPDTDAHWKDADSVKLLQSAMESVRAAGYLVVNVDVTVIAERPKLLPHLEAMRANLAAALGIDVSAVSIKGKTNETVGEIGRGEAMACHAVALLVRSDRA